MEILFPQKPEEPQGKEFLSLKPWGIKTDRKLETLTVPDKICQFEGVTIKPKKNVWQIDLPFKANFLDIYSQFIFQIMYFLNVPPISLLDDRDPPSKILKEPRGLYASKVADLMTSWQTIPRWPAESQVSLFQILSQGRS